MVKFLKVAYLLWNWCESEWTRFSAELNVSKTACRFRLRFCFSKKQQKSRDQNWLKILNVIALFIKIEYGISPKHPKPHLPPTYPSSISEFPNGFLKTSLAYLWMAFTAGLKIPPFSGNCLTNDRASIELVVIVQQLQQTTEGMRLLTLVFIFHGLHQSINQAINNGSYFISDQTSRDTDVDCRVKKQKKSQNGWNNQDFDLLVFLFFLFFNDIPMVCLVRYIVIFRARNRSWTTLPKAAATLLIHRTKDTF